MDGPGENYFVILQTRNVGRLDVDPPRHDPPLGSIPYLAVYAHSTSRQQLYPEVRRALEAQFDLARR